MGVNSLPKTVTRQHLGCDLNPGPSPYHSATEPPFAHCSLIMLFWCVGFMLPRRIPSTALY